MLDLQLWRSYNQLWRDIPGAIGSINGFLDYSARTDFFYRLHSCHGRRAGNFEVVGQYAPVNQRAHLNKQSLHLASIPEQREVSRSIRALLEFDRTKSRNSDHVYYHILGHTTRLSLQIVSFLSQSLSERRRASQLCLCHVNVVSKPDICQLQWHDAILTSWQHVVECEHLQEFKKVNLHRGCTSVCPDP